MCSNDPTPIIQMMKRFGSITKLTLAFLILASLFSLSDQQKRTAASAHFVSAAVQSNSISCGQTLTGNIMAAAQQDLYTFTANAGEAVIIAAMASSGTLVARAELYDPANMIKGHNGSGNTTTGIINLTVTGTYTIIVRDNNLTKTGTYGLNLQFISGRCAVEIACGETKTEIQMPLRAQQDTYAFSALAGEAVNIAAVATSGTLVARLELYGPNKTLIASSGSGNTNTGSVKLTMTGVYIILVRDNNISKVGRYNLNLQFTTGRCGKPIAGGQLLSGSIVRAEQDSFVFFGQQSGSVIISSVATSGTLVARAELYNPMGTLVGSNGSGNTSTGTITLQDTGIFTILVRDNNLTKTGNYNLSLTCLGNACPPAVTVALTPASQTIAASTDGNMTVTISPAQSTATTVMLNSTNPAVATVAASVTIAANATTASFAVTGVALGTATIIAALPVSLGGGANGSVTVAQPCQPNSMLPSDFKPFSQIYYITGPTATGDRLVVGKMALQQLNAVPLPGQAEQRFCTPVQLAEGVSAISYVPSANERSGDFSSFAGLLIDPLTGTPFPAGLIPANRLGDPHAWRILNLVGSPAIVSGASYSAVALASESIASAFGSRLATATATAPSQPLPIVLAETKVKVIDSKAVVRDAPLFFVSPDQVNFQIPAGVSVGAATVIITNSEGANFIGITQIAAIAPGLFTANADGQGVVAGEAVRVAADGKQTPVVVLQLDQTQNKFVPLPIDLGPEGEQIFLILYGTGFRFRNIPGVVTCLIGDVEAEVTYAGNQNEYVGLDQCNVRIPRSLIGRGEVDIELTIDGKAANAVKIAIK